MCGLTGFWCVQRFDDEEARGWLKGMTDVLLHRGPDAEGAFVDADAQLGLGHRRLSILDLSEAGQQPMWSHSKRFCIAYNGEVYNAPEIRQELESEFGAIEWRGHSDTETMLEAIDAWGLEASLERFVGMFAFALWDTRERTLTLGRDRLGIKPLYVARQSFGVAFASELRAFRGFGRFSAKLDRNAVAEYLRYGVTPNSHCVMQDVYKIEPGTVEVFRSASAAGEVHRYWSAADIAAERAQDPFDLSAEEACDELGRKLGEAVRMRMRSDVPFGAFLSGGIDSSSVVAMMQQHSNRPVRTFCIGNASDAYDESKQAAEVAKHLGCDHTTLIADGNALVDLVPTIASRWDEPFADSSQIPTYMVSKLAREHVTVALSGDGGDELFGGYNRHLWAPRVWAVAGRIPFPLRRGLRALKSVPVESWDRLFASVGSLMPMRLPGDKMHKLATVAQARSSRSFYRSLRSHWESPYDVVQGASNTNDDAELSRLETFAEQMMLADLQEYLPDDILTKVDRASMAASLEARVPILDHRVAEFAFGLPLEFKIRDGVGKWVLRKLLERSVPASLFDRPKMGFGVPIGEWVKGPLRSWAADLLDQTKVKNDNVLAPDVVSQTWDDHLHGHGQQEHRLWTLLMFQSWWSHNRDWVES